MLPADTSRIGDVLLAIARAAIARELQLPLYAGKTAADETAPWLCEPHATFVTLRQGDALRGCIGSVDAERSLLADLQHNAAAAAFRDPRFAPLRVEEFAATTIEVSLLTPPVALTSANSEASAIAQLVPRRDGVILEYGLRRATFLPQVWESLPEPRQFLAELKQKAGLARSFWSSAIRVSRYGVSKWSEAETAGAAP
jgi:AmmeMemoRadiSam system protein A